MFRHNSYFWNYIPSHSAIEVPRRFNLSGRHHNVVSTAARVRQRYGFFTTFSVIYENFTICYCFALRRGSPRCSGLQSTLEESLREILHCVQNDTKRCERAILSLKVFYVGKGRYLILLYRVGNSKGKRETRETLATTLLFNHESSQIFTTNTHVLRLCGVVPARDPSAAALCQDDTRRHDIITQNLDVSWQVATLLLTAG